MNIQLLQWNIWYKEDPNNTLAFIKEVDPDIACLQEVTINYPTTNFCNVPQLFKDAGYFVHFKEAQYWPTENGKAYQGNMIVSKFPFTRMSHHYVQDMKHDNFDDYSTEGRVVVSAEVSCGNRNITIATTHLSYNHRFEETEAKKKEEYQLLDYVAQFRNNFILTGDFNVTPSSQLITKLKNNLQHLGPDYSENSWTTKPFSYNGFEETELNWRLDYAFSTPDIVARSSRTLKTDISDHLPVLVEIKI